MADRSPQTETFVTYTHIDQLKAPEKRRQVNTYAARHIKQTRHLKATRLLTKPGTRPRILQWGLRKADALDSPVPPNTEVAVANSPDEIDPRIFDDYGSPSTVLGSFRNDPFNSYPIPVSPRIQLIIDHCMHLRLRPCDDWTGSLTRELNLPNRRSGVCPSKRQYLPGR